MLSSTVSLFRVYCLLNCVVSNLSLSIQCVCSWFLANNADAAHVLRPAAFGVITSSGRNQVPAGFPSAGVSFAWNYVQSTVSRLDCHAACHKLRSLTRLYLTIYPFLVSKPRSYTPYHAVSRASARKSVFRPFSGGPARGKCAVVDAVSNYLHRARRINRAAQAHNGLYYLSL